MLLNNCKKILFSIIILACSVTLFAATTDLSVRFLDKANEAFEDNNIEDAYKYVNQALAVAKDKESQANVLYFAQTVYSVKLQNLLGNYDEMAFIDIQMNLEKYPNGKLNICKQCITQKVDNWDPETFLWILEKFDLPYIESEWNIVVAPSDLTEENFSSCNAIAELVKKLQPTSTNS